MGLLFHIHPLAPADEIRRQPFSHVQVRIRSFDHFLKCLTRPERFDAFQTRRPVIMAQDDFKEILFSTAELERINTFKSLKKQVEWMAGRSLVKDMVMEHISQGAIPYPAHPDTGCRPEPGSDGGYSSGAAVPLPAADTIIVEQEKKGAPFLPSFPKTALSISHAGGYAGVALCPAGSLRLGLDLESIKSMPEPGFMTLAFSPGEQALFGTDPATVFQGWTLKEAFLKYLRTGFHTPLHQVEVKPDHIRFQGQQAPVEVWCARMGNSHVVSLVVESS